LQELKLKTVILTKEGENRVPIKYFFLYVILVVDSLGFPNKKHTGKNFRFGGRVNFPKKIQND